MVQEHKITDCLVNCVSTGLEECVINLAPYTLLPVGGWGGGLRRLFDGGVVDSLIE